MAERGGLVFLGTPDFAVASLRALVESGERIALVVTQPDRPRGRSRGPQPPPVKEFALSQGLPVAQPARVRDPEFLARFVALGAEAAIVAAYGQILPPAMLEAPLHGCINVHASLLPRFRGAAPIQHAILCGDRVTGITIMQMDEGLDTGPMLLRRELEIQSSDTGGTLHDRLAELGSTTLLDALESLRAGALVAEPQDPAQATHAGMLRKSDGRLDWSDSSVDLGRRVLAMHPWPGAQTSLNGLRLKVHPPVSADDSGHSERPGVVLEIGVEGIRVACGSGTLMLGELQLEGRRRMPVSEFLRGSSLTVGTQLGELE